MGGSTSECQFWSEYYTSIGVNNIIFHPRVAHAKIRKYQFDADLLFFIVTRSSDIYWCTSPLKIFEYMATGTAILAANIGSVKEIISDDNAFCFDPDIDNSLEVATRKRVCNILETKKK